MIFVPSSIPGPADPLPEAAGADAPPLTGGVDAAGEEALDGLGVAAPPQAVARITETIARAGNLRRFLIPSSSNLSLRPGPTRHPPVPVPRSEQYTTTHAIECVHSFAQHSSAFCPSPVRGFSEAPRE